MARKDDQFAGVIFLLCGLTFLLLPLMLNGAEHRILKQLKPIHTASIKQLSYGDTVLVEGRISSQNPIWQAGLILGSRQVYQGGDEGWRDDPEFVGTFLLELDSHELIEIKTGGGLPRGRYSTIKHPSNDDLRWVGFSAKAELTCWGEVERLFPRLRVEIDDASCFGGSVDEFKDDVLFENRWFGISALLSLLCGGYLLWRGTRGKVQTAV